MPYVDICKRLSHAAKLSNEFLLVKSLTVGKWDQIQCKLQKVKTPTLNFLLVTPLLLLSYIRRLFLQHEGLEFLAYIVVNVFTQLLPCSLLKATGTVVWNNIRLSNFLFVSHTQPFDCEKRLTIRHQLVDDLI